MCFFSTLLKTPVFRALLLFIPLSAAAVDSQAQISNALVAIPFDGNIRTESTLGLDDVKPTMQKLFDEHIAIKEMNKEILLRAHKRFLEEMDADGVYFTEEEASSFTDGANADQYLKEWNKNRFDSFSAMVSKMRSAIFRARACRAALCSKLKNMKAARQDKAIQGLFQAAASINFPKPSWPSGVQNLKNRQEALFLQRSLDLGLSPILTQDRLKDGVHMMNPLFDKVEEEYRKKEADWLFLDADGRIENTLAQETFLAQKIMKALSMSLDAHSTVFNDQEAKNLKTRLSKQMYGTGISYSISEETVSKIASSQGGKPSKQSLIVSRLTPASPAAQLKKIEPGDAILSINDIPSSTLISSPQKIDQLLGDSASPQEVKLVILPKNRRVGSGEVEVTVRKGYFTSDKDRLDITRFDTEKGVVYALKLHSFYASEDESVSSENDMRQALEYIKNETGEKNPLLGIILDLRDNRGGYLLQAVKVSGLFIQSGVIVVAKYSNGEERAFRDLDPQVLYDGPFLVLTSKITASAAEIVAQSLKDYGVALVVGDERTYGKGSIQMQTATEEKSGAHPETDSYFKVTVGQYYSVAGESPQVEGVKAQVVIPGIWSKQRVGEGYLESALPNSGPIREKFNDTLFDVPSDEKKWMRNYYIPFLQKPTDRFESYVPELQFRSTQRLSKDQSWRLFFSGEYDQLIQKRRLNQENMKEAIERVVNEMQLDEAVRVLIDLHALSKASGRSISSSS